MFLSKNICEMSLLGKKQLQRAKETFHKEMRRRHATFNAVEVLGVFPHLYQVCDPCHGQGPGSVRAKAN